MKKFLVLFLLFVVPIVAYLFFASGVNSFTALPTLKKELPEFNNWVTENGDTIKLEGKITVLGFGGSNLYDNRGNLFNLSQKVYKRYREFKDLQFVYLCPASAKDGAQAITKKLEEVIPMEQWHFVYASPEEIDAYYNAMNVRTPLNQYHGTTMVYLIDKNRNLRGRNGEGKDYIDGYNTFHPSIVSQELLDDFKVLLYEYKAAYKRNNNATEKLKGL